MKQSDTIIDILYDRFIQFPSKLIFKFISFPNEEICEEGLTYKTLYHSMSHLASKIQESGERGDRVILCFSLNDQRRFLIAFFATLLAGRIAVPVYAPKKNRSLEKFKSILKDSGANQILSSETIIENFQSKFDEAYEFPGEWIAATQVENIDTVQAPDLSLDAVAFLQYTSGSTGSPKGVMVTHRNLIDNQIKIKKTFGHDENSVFVGWLPLFHDMGLIGNVLQPLYLNSLSVLMSPACFLQKPSRWLRAISHFNAHTSGGPNFAYDLCLKAFDDMPENIDLSCWKVAFNGAEPIQHQTLQAFVQRFKRFQFNSKAISPCYGLAEATLLVSGSHPSKTYVYSELDAGMLQNHQVTIEQSGKALVSSGPIQALNIVKIVHPETCCECTEPEVGEIWVTGESIAKGYWNNQEETKRIFYAQIQNDNRSYYLRTGDLGFIREGELYVTGRIKDLIIIRGKNYYPQDIELAAKFSHPSVRKHAAAAFSVVLNDEEKLVVAVELERRASEKSFEEIVSCVQSSIQMQCEIKAHEIVLLKVGGLPLTTSGKVQRQKLKSSWLQGLIDTKYSSINGVAVHKGEGHKENKSELISIITQLVQDKVPSQQVDQNTPLAHYGLDSMDYVQLLQKLSQSSGEKFELVDIIELDTISEISEVLSEVKSVNTFQQVLKPNIKSLVSCYKLNPLQSAIYKLQKQHPQSSHYYLVRSLTISQPTSAEKLREIVTKLVDLHPILRSRLVSTESGIQIEETRSIDEIIRLKMEGDQSDSIKKLEDLLFDEMNICFEDRLFSVVISENNHVVNLSFGISHIIMDLWSISVLAEDFITLMNNQASVRSVPYSDHVTGLLSNNFTKEKTYWAQYFKDHPCSEAQLNLRKLPDYHERKDQYAALHQFSLGGSLTKKLSLFCQDNGVSIYTMLLCSFAFTLYKYTGQRNLLIGSPFNNRLNTDSAKTVGLFVNTLPMIINIDTKKTIISYLNTMHKLINQCHAHQGLPLSKILELINADSTLLSQQQSLYDALFTYQRAPQALEEPLVSLLMPGSQCVREFNGTELMIHPSSRVTADVSFDMAVINTGNVIKGYLKSPRGMFPDQFQSQFVKHFKRTLTLFVEDSDEILTSCNLMSQDEVKQLHCVVPNPDIEISEQVTLIDLFNDAVKARGSEIALVDESSQKTMSYAELDSLSDALAEHLA